MNYNYLSIMDIYRRKKHEVDYLLGIEYILFPFEYLKWRSHRKGPSEGSTSYIHSI